jgi:hypothetical protein
MRVQLSQNLAGEEYFRVGDAISIPVRRPLKSRALERLKCPWNEPQQYRLESFKITKVISPNIVEVA